MCHVRELIARWQFFRGSTPLFRSLTNLNYAASAYQLHQMFRSVFISAGINASSGSLRRVVADQFFTDGQSLDHSNFVVIGVVLRHFNIIISGSNVSLSHSCI